MLTSLAVSILTKFLNGSHSTSLSTQKITTLTLLTSYTTIIHQYQDALHAKLSNTYSPAINTTTYTYLLAPTSTLTHHAFSEYLSNGQTDCTVALIFFPHYKLNTYHCPKCHTHHPLDPITMVTECETA